ncbi:hypothetical protein [Rhodococcus marinonascens]|uniref:hypothetical protein n=1 Tax=Rhodococcus marinonascens TaxID=38311 RepID=UPI000933B1DC|nr:hypothetical protein [Rhodococcus marinonascens]
MFEDYLAKIGDRTAVYEAARELAGGRVALYPGSFLDATPLNVWAEVTFVDKDKNYVKRVRNLDHTPPGARFLITDYQEPISEVDDDSADVLISLFAGPISHFCTRYLKVGGYLLANNSHGDASIAMLDPRYRLIAVQTATAHSFRTSDLTDFQVAKRPTDHRFEEILTSQRGVAFKRSAQYYLFRREA